MRGEISLESFSGSADGREAVEKFLWAVVREFENNPLTRRIVTNPEEWLTIARRVPPEVREANVADSTQAVSFLYPAGAGGGPDLVRRPGGHGRAYKVGCGFRPA